MRKIIALFGLLLVLSLIVGCAKVQEEAAPAAPAAEEGAVVDESAAPADAAEVAVEESTEAPVEAETPAEDAAVVSEEAAEEPATEGAEATA